LYVQAYATPTSEGQKWHKRKLFILLINVMVFHQALWPLAGQGRTVSYSTKMN
jgi:hypothetical protein